MTLFTQWLKQQFKFIVSTEFPFPTSCSEPELWTNNRSPEPLTITQLLWESAELVHAYEFLHSLCDWLSDSNDSKAQENQKQSKSYSLFRWIK